MCAAGWGWCRSIFAMRQERQARWWRAGVPVARIVPGEGVLLESGERIGAAVVVSNADPRRTLTMLGQEVDDGWKAAVERCRLKAAP